MTFTDIVNRVAGLMNITTVSGIYRIGVSVNEAYREITSELRLQPTGTSTLTTTGTNIVTFTGVEKLFGVFYGLPETPPRHLDLVSIDKFRTLRIGTGNSPGNYMIRTWGASSVTIALDATPDSPYLLYADAGPNLTDLSGAQIPVFTESYHNALIYKAKAIEYEKMEKFQAADRELQKYIDRLNDLKQYIAVSASLRLYQGSHRRR